MNTKTDKGKFIGIIVGVIVASAVSGLVRKYIFNEGNNIDQQLKTASEITNKTCPVYVDSLTKMDSTQALPGKTFQYNYTLKIDTAIVSLNELKTNLKTNILNSIKTNSSMKGFRDNNVTIDYKYNDEKGNFLFKLDFSPDDYNQ